MSLAMNTRATIVPCVRYRDARRAIDWLCSTFGFEKKFVHDNPDGSVAHAQLTFGPGMVMVSSAQADTAFGRYMQQPEEIDRRETQTPYVVTHDPDEIYRQAQAAGAEILIEIADQDYGGRGFSCRDPEGHIWSFGSYDPWGDV